MFEQYGSVLCISCKSSMRLATIVPGDAGISAVTFECRYSPCARSRILVLAKPELGRDVICTAAQGCSDVEAFWLPGIVHRTITPQPHDQAMPRSLQTQMVHA
jgi:hypothetical protein